MPTETTDAALGNACASLPAATLDELKSIARQYDEASGLVMKLANWAGDKAGGALAMLPEDWQARVSEATNLALREAYKIAATTQGDEATSEPGLLDRALGWAKGERWHQVATGLTGALGGAGGLATTLIDLPVTITLMLRSIQQIAAGYGEDLTDEAVRSQCVAVFALGGPQLDDDAGETGFVAARLALSGKAVAEILSAVLPRLSIVVSNKALAQATPLLGAVAGAAINPTFTGYYQTMAHVHFRLRRLERDGDAEQVRACFERVLRARRGVK